MLAVDWKHGGAMLTHGVHEERAGHDQRLLVGQQHALAGAHSSERRAQPCCADDGRHHGIAVGVARNFFQCLAAETDLDAGGLCAELVTQCIRRDRRTKHRHLRAKLAAEQRELVGLRVGGQRKNAVLVGMTAHHVERAVANGAGGAKNGQTHHVRTPQEISSAASGNTGSSASIRSSTPPWPGNRRLLSFMPT